MKHQPRPPGKRQQAVAVRYKADEDVAPRVIAKGQGVLAERILEIAHAEGIHIQEDPDLVGLLAKLDINAPIPEALYKAVAEVLAFVYRLNRGYGK